MKDTERKYFEKEGKVQCKLATFRYKPSPISKSIPKVEGWYHKTLLLSHEPIRKDTQRLIWVLQRLTPDDQSIKQFFQWYNEEFQVRVYFHQQMDSFILQPRVFQQVNNKIDKELNDKLNINFDEIIQKMLYVLEIENLWIKARKSFQDATLFIDGLKNEVQKLKDLIFEFLNYEEDILTLQLKNNFTEQEINDLSSKIEEKEGMKQHLIILPWIIDSAFDWAGKEYVDEMIDKLPFLTRIISTYCLINQRNSNRKFESLVYYDNIISNKIENDGQNADDSQCKCFF